MEVSESWPNKRLDEIEVRRVTIFKILGHIHVV
jgi:hypothetical protein